jgi:hypothetical protein
MTFDLLTLGAKVYGGGGGSLTVARTVCVLSFIDLHKQFYEK